MYFSGRRGYFCEICQFLCGALLLLTDTAYTDTRHGIHSIHAFPYYHETGKVGHEDLLEPSMVLWNSVIGEGDVGAPTRVTFVLIHVDALMHDGSTTLQVVARTSKVELLRQSIALAPFLNGTKQVAIPFLVYETGCEPLEITAALSGQDAPETAIVPFRCGE